MNLLLNSQNYKTLPIPNNNYFNTYVLDTFYNNNKVLEL